MNTPYQDIQALSYSGAKELLRSPSHYQAWLKEERKETPALKIGRLAHLALLEPAKFNETVKLGPDVDNKAKKEWKDFVASLGDGVEAVTPDEYATISGIVDSAELALAHLKVDGNVWETEQYLLAEYNGVPIKGRPDLVTEIDGKRVCIDLKTCGDASPWAFGRDINEYKYHLQQAFYRVLTKTEMHILIAVEKEAPFGFRIYTIDEASTAVGQSLMDEAVALYSACSSLDKWPGYDHNLTTISIPKYALSNTQ